MKSLALRASVTAALMSSVGASGANKDPDAHKRQILITSDPKFDELSPEMQGIALEFYKSLSQKFNSSFYRVLITDRPTPQQVSNSVLWVGHGLTDHYLKDIPKRIKVYIPQTKTNNKKYGSKFQYKHKWQDPLHYMLSAVDEKELSQYQF